MSQHGSLNTTEEESDENFAVTLTDVAIDLKNACEKKPHPKMLEECKLKEMNGSQSCFNFIFLFA